MFDNLFSPIPLLIVLLIYLLPIWISIKRNHPQHLYIALTNIFLGGTGVGWIIALLWSLNGVIVIQSKPLIKQQ